MVVGVAAVDGVAGAGESNSYCPAHFATDLGPETKDRNKGLGFDDEEGCAHCHLHS